jgi:hypothetical protein
MVPLAIVGVFSIIIFAPLFVVSFRKRASATYRCPHCAQIASGQYHRRKCLPQNSAKDNVLGQRAAEKQAAVTDRMTALQVQSAHPASRPS